MKKRLKILFLSNRGLLPIKDGHTRRSFNILKGLCEKNDVFFLSLYENENEINEEIIRVFKKVCAQVEFIQGPSKKFGISMLSRLMLSLFSKKPYSIWRHYSRRYEKRVVAVAKENEFDIVHCDILPIAYVLNKIDDKYVSFTDHDVSFLKSLRMARETKNLFLKILLYLEYLKMKNYEKCLISRANITFAVSTLDKNLLAELNPNGNFEIVENGVDTEVFTPGNDEVERDGILWIGGFENQSNRNGIYYYLERIWPIIKRDNPKAETWIIGGGITDKLKAEGERDRKLKIMGFVDDPVPYLRKASVFIVPIISGSGTRLKMLEAMAMGKAIVTTKVGCEGIEGESGTHFWVADDPKKYAKAVVALMKDDSQRKLMGESARKLVIAKYDWKIINNKINCYYKKEIDRIRVSNKGNGSL